MAFIREQGPWWAGESGAVRVRSVASVTSDTLWPRGLQPTRLLGPWDSSGKDIGVGCHGLLQRQW